MLQSLVLLIFCTAVWCSLRHPLVNPDGATFDFNSNYIINIDSDENGGCKTWADNLEQSYKDALEMVDTAREAMEDLREEIPDQATQRNEWLRKAEPYVAMFNQKPRRDKLPSGETEFLTPRARNVWGVSLISVRHPKLRRLY